MTQTMNIQNIIDVLSEHHISVCWAEPINGRIAVATLASTPSGEIWVCDMNMTERGPDGRTRETQEKKMLSDLAEMLVWAQQRLQHYRMEEIDPVQAAQEEEEGEWNPCWNRSPASAAKRPAL